MAMEVPKIETSQNRSSKYNGATYWHGSMEFDCVKLIFSIDDVEEDAIARQKHTINFGRTCRLLKKKRVNDVSFEKKPKINKNSANRI